MWMCTNSSSLMCFRSWLLRMKVAWVVTRWRFHGSNVNLKLLPQHRSLASSCPHRYFYNTNMHRCNSVLFSLSLSAPCDKISPFTLTPTTILTAPQKRYVNVQWCKCCSSAFTPFVWPRTACLLKWTSVYLFWSVEELARHWPRATGRSLINGNDPGDPRNAAFHTAAQRRQCEIMFPWHVTAAAVNVHTGAVWIPIDIYI